MFDLDDEQVQEIKRVMELIDSADYFKQMDRGKKLLLTLIEQPVALGLLKGKVQSPIGEGAIESSRKSRALLLKFGLTDEMLTASHEDFDYMTLLFGFVACHYPVLLTERARKDGEQPNLDTLKMSFLDIFETAKGVRLSLCFCDKRISQKQLRDYHYSGFPRSIDTVTLFEDSTALIKLISRITGVDQALINVMQQGADTPVVRFDFNLKDQASIFRILNMLIASGVALDNEKGEHNELIYMLIKTELNAGEPNNRLLRELLSMTRSSKELQKMVVKFFTSELISRGKVSFVAGVLDTTPETVLKVHAMANTRLALDKYGVFKPVTQTLEHHVKKVSLDDDERRIVKCHEAPF